MTIPLRCQTVFPDGKRCPNRASTQRNLYGYWVWLCQSCSELE